MTGGIYVAVWFFFVCVFTDMISEDQKQAHIESVRGK